jgi:hypothetical protein
MKVNRETFQYICSKVAPFMKKRNTRMKDVIPIETSVSLTIEHSMKMIVNLSGVGLSFNWLIVIEFLQANSYQNIFLKIYIDWFNMLWWAMEHTHHNPSCFHHLKGKKMVFQEKNTIGISFRTTPRCV